MVKETTINRCLRFTHYAECARRDEMFYSRLRRDNDAKVYRRIALRYEIKVATLEREILADLLQARTNNNLTDDFLI